MSLEENSEWVVDKWEKSGTLKLTKMCLIKEEVKMQGLRKS